MNTKIFIALLGFLFLTTTFAVETDGDVLVLTDDNFDEELAKHETLLVEFYAPWCGHCKTLAPNYAKAATKLKEANPPLYIAKVDSTVQTGISSRFGIQGYPTLKFFKNGEPSEYGGGRSADEIIAWVTKKSGPPSKALKSSKELEEFSKSGKVTVVYFGSEDDSEYKDNFLKIASKFDKVLFSHTSEGCENCHEEVGVSKRPALVLFKDFDEGKSVFEGAWDNTELENFINTHMHPTVITFDDSTIEPVFQKKNPAIILFRDNNSEDTPNLDKIFAEVANEKKGQILFTISDVKDGIQKRLAEFVGVEQSSLPTIMIVDTREGMSKFRFETDINKENVLEFVSNWKSGKASRHLKSEEPPAANDEPVKVLVGKTFNDIVYDETKDVLVEFYAPWCGHCKSLAPIYDELAAKVASNKDLIIAKMDSTANEVEAVEVQSFPTLKFFPKNNKKTPIDFNGERSLEGFLAFFKEQGVYEAKDEL